MDALLIHYEKVWSNLKRLNQLLRTYDAFIGPSKCVRCPVWWVILIVSQSLHPDLRCIIYFFPHLIYYLMIHGIGSSVATIIFKICY